MKRKANGATIRALRIALGIPQVSLAGRVGIDKSYMSQIEHGSRQPGPAVLLRIASELGTSLDVITYPVHPEAEVAS